MQMKSFYQTAAILTLAVGMAACVETADETQEAGTDTAAATAQPGSTLSDAEIAHVAKTANDADIEGGNMAREKAQNAEVKSFGALMVSDHSALNQQAAQLAQAAGLTLTDNPASQQLMAQHQQAQQRLQSLSGAAFDTAYIAHEVDMHQNLLNALDQTLIPNTQNAELRNLLGTARTQVEAHLNRARDIQGKLGRGDN
jgi:putative membrane protein